VKDGKVALSQVVSATIGAIGWAAAGPLVATLLVGRTALFFPSLRWLLVAGLTWLGTMALAWLARSTAGSPSADLRAGQASPARGLAVRLGAALASLVLLGGTAPLLPLLYLDDSAYHAVAGGAAARPLTLYLILLATIGSVAARLFQFRVSSSEFRVDGPPGTVNSEPGTRDSARSAAVAVPVLAVGLMVGANYGVFGALQPFTATMAAAILPLAASLLLGVLAASLGVAAWGGGRLAAAVVALAWLAFAPWREGLVTSPAFALALLLGAAALFAFTRRREVIPGTLLGGLTALVPPAGAALAALALLGKWRAALAGLLVAATLLWLTPLHPPLPGPDSGLGTRDAGPALALAGTANLANAALGGFHARLFSGPGALTVPIPVTAPRAALALTIGTLAVGSWLTAWAIRRAASTGGALRGAPEADLRVEATAICLAMVAGLLLAGTTPRQQLAPAMLVLLPFAGRHSWEVLQRLPGRWGLTSAALLAGGYLMAGTSVPAMANATAPFLTRWPTLASVPALGLLLLTASLTMLLPWGRQGAPRLPAGEGEILLAGAPLGGASQAPEPPGGEGGAKA
jgi:hypothetical protein